MDQHSKVMAAWGRVRRKSIDKVREMHMHDNEEREHQHQDHHGEEPIKENVVNNEDNHVDTKKEDTDIELDHHAKAMAAWGRARRKSIDKVREMHMHDHEHHDHHHHDHHGEDTIMEKTDDNEDNQEDQKKEDRKHSLNKATSKMKLFTSSKTATQKDFDWIVQERLKSNFYLDDGVSKWHIIHPVANGDRQSPIDIQTGRAKLDVKLKPIQVDYGKGCVKSVTNTGNSFQVNVDDKLATFIGGCLENEFRLIQFHAHWGTTAGAKGSEHTVNGKLYDAELHLVHWNTKHKLFSKAVTEPDGLAVIGIFLEVGEEDHPEFEKVLKVFSKIPFKNMKTPYEEEIDPAKFLPDDMSYWNYQGSLTTPPLEESVLWHVLRTPITISKKQLDIMAGLRTGTEACNDTSCIINNFRPPMPLCGRKVGLFNGEVDVKKATPVAHGVDDHIVAEVSQLKSMVEEMKLSLSSVSKLEKEIKELKEIIQQKP